MAATSREDFDALIRRAGLALSSEEVDEIYVGWGYAKSAGIDASTSTARC